MFALVFLLAQVVSSDFVTEGCQSDACLADLESEEAALIDVQLLQTSLSSARTVNSLRSAELESAPDHRDEVISRNGTWLVGDAIPGLASRSLLMQMSVVRALNDASAKTQVDIGLPEHLFDNKPWSIVSSYFLLYVMSVVSMLFCMNVGTRRLEVIKNVDAVDDPWKEGLLGWLGVTWLNPVISRLGNAANPANSKIIPEELPDIGMQHTEATERFERLWREEVKLVGEDKASLCSVLARVWTFKKMACFTLLIGVRVVAGNIFSVLLIQHSLSYFAWLSGYVSSHGELPDMSYPMIATIGCFSILPATNILITSWETGMLAKFDRQLVGVVIFIFKKTQRLPASSLGSEVESAKDDSSATKKPNALSTINIDLISNFHGVAYNIATLVNSFVCAFILVSLLVTKLGLATLFSLAVAIPGIVLSAIMTGGLAVSLMQYQGLMDKRSTCIREILQGIRVVKCCAWEEAMEKKVSDLRGIEIGCLRSYFRTTGAFVCFFSTFPRCLTIAGLAGYTYLYGQSDLATIFGIVQVLASLRACCDMFASSMMRVVNLGPSAARVEQYLKLEEAPVLPGIRVPNWVQMWPLPGQVADASPAFKLHGSFAFSSKPGAASVLQDLKLDVPQGQMVGIVGSVGCGKSTLLQAALGELHPLKSGSVAPYLARPQICAYCPQVPHIAEGTLRDNVLFGEPYDEERYSQAVVMAALEKDLELLPGGDGALIGARGISLSGGQRARVALARAAYNRSAELALIDDPFGALDAPTGQAVLDRLLCGPLMSSRTRIVVLQPEPERLQRFDWVLVMSDGRVVASGKPEDIVRAEAFKVLQSSMASSEGGEWSPQVAVETPVARVPRKDPAITLREEEMECRPTWQMLREYICMGRWRNLANGMVLYVVVLLLYLFCDLSLANWTDAMSHDPHVSAKPYLTGYFFWLMAATAIYLVSWKFGEWFSIRISAATHSRVLHQLLRAPIDRFYDKQPLGRLMNRLTTDVAALDLSMYTRIIGCVMSLLGNAMPLIYIHCIMPWIVTVLAIPFYVTLYKVYMLYQNSCVPMRYCTLSSISRVNNLVSDIMANGLVVRGLGQEERLLEEFAVATGQANKASLLEERFLKRWVMNRFTYLWSFFNTTVFIVGLYNVTTLGAGQLGLALTNLLLIEAMMDTSLMVVSGTIFQLISLARLHEYLGVVQERPSRLLQDAPLENFTVSFLQKATAKMTWTEKDGVVEVSLHGEPFLVSSEDGRVLLFSGGKERKMQDICPSCKALGQVSRTHRLVSANSAFGSAKDIAQELCSTGKRAMSAASFSKAAEVHLEFRSSWLADGARVEVDNLHVGYADMQQNVLKGVSFSLAPRMKAAIVGTTGCGKSSLLLALLRVLEPRAGRVLINFVDTREVGLSTLRSSLGLVPQEPILFSGTLRHNLDPFNKFTDGRIKQAVNATHLEQFIKNLPLGLDHMVSDEGGNLSFGQRQLLCLARMVLRQPALLLLDEATSAIDPHTQELVQETLNEAFPTSTQIAVAHRLETILKFDHVVVLDKGVVAEQGSVKDLQSQDGHFKRMLQAKGL